MGVDGTYDVGIKSPMGTMSAKLVMKSAGGTLSGSLDGQLGRAEFDDGSVSGDAATWSMTVQSPMGPMALTVDLTVTGDEVKGQVKTGGFGSFPISGKRA
jgi:hypothetical protein